MPGRLGSPLVLHFAEGDRKAVAAVLDLDPVGRSSEDGPAAIQNVDGGVTRTARPDEDVGAADLLDRGAVTLDEVVHWWNLSREEGQPWVDRP